MLLSLLAGAGYYYLTLPVPPSVAISFAAPSQIFVGDPFTVSISVKNESSNPIRNGALTLLLPSGVSVVGQPPSGQSFVYAFPDIVAQGLATVTSTLIATGNPQSVAHLSARAAYTVASSSKQFASESTADIAIGAPAVGLTVTAPPSAVSGSGIQLVLHYENNTPDILPPMTLTLNSPSTFVVQTSSAVVSGNNGTWQLESLAPGTVGTITVGGIVGAAASGTTYGFGETLAETLAGQDYAIGGSTANVAIVTPPLALSIMANNSSDYISGANDWLSYVLSYANNANVPFMGVTVTAKLSGVMFDFSTLATNGSFDSLTDTVTWSPAAIRAFATLASGESGALTFRIKTLKQISAHSASDKDYLLRVDGKITSPSILPGVTATSTTFGNSITTKVGGVITVAANGYHFEKKSGITNAGPYPPIVNQETDYTIHWILGATVTDASNVTVSTLLPPGVSFTGVMKSNVSSTPQYTPATGMVTWQVPFIPANAGTVAPAPEAVFQISDMPAVNQVGRVISLLGGTSVQATDVFTGENLTASADGVTTDLPSDATARSLAHGSGAVRAQ